MDGLCMGGSGAGYGTRKKRKQRQERGERTIPAISFFRPYWELCFRTKLVIGKFAVKTFKTPYNYRGLILCHSGIKTAPGPIRSYALNEDKLPLGVVGCAVVEDSRLLSLEEKDKLFEGYNNAHTEKQIARAWVDEDSIIAAEFGIFIPLDRIYRFKMPFVPPQQHVFGPRARIPLYPEIKRQLPAWATALLESEVA